MMAAAQAGRAEAPDPVAAPLTYPGAPPSGPAVVVTATSTIELRPPASPPGEWSAVDDRTLDEVLRAAGAAPMAARSPVLAVGSNASPAQLRRKFRSLPNAAVPVIRAEVSGLRVGVSAHVSRAGYLPATPVADPAASSPLFITWLNEAELAAMDTTEPNYSRDRLPDMYIVQMAGQQVRNCWIYVSVRGFLIDTAGHPRELTGQPELIASVLEQFPELADIAGRTPQEWVQRAAAPAVRFQIDTVLRTAARTVSLLA
jgi:hypothetical protein